MDECKKCYATVALPDGYEPPEHGLCWPCSSEEVTKLRTEVELSHNNLEMFRDNLARVGKEKKDADLQASALMSLLKRCEWGDSSGSEPVKICPVCEQNEGYGHNDDCELAEVVGSTNFHPTYLKANDPGRISAGSLASCLFLLPSSCQHTITSPSQPPLWCIRTSL